MGEKLRTKIEVVALIMGVVTGAGGMFGAFYLLPYRMNAVEIRVERMHAQHTTDRELLLRIEERLIAVQAELRRPK